MFIYDFCSGAVSNLGCIAIKCYDAGFDVWILVTVKVSVVWDVTLCSHMCMDVSEERAASISWWKKRLCMTSQERVVGEIRRHAKNGVRGVSLPMLLNGFLFVANSSLLIIMEVRGFSKTLVHIPS